ncbi:N-acetyllactosaminide beta-1,3-N-acetylglucosaminyltransferase 2-like [Protopterus annectens]|uniref:N-acetyllactosaminide beta-1,3-N-acetylglucosaminyltransferase 2-like n=1 Tax=Protopterus annectens TaxID=7888 RepID=UPI001CF9386A|nr:N-acetyllactosaminide beta-1,3-N-acetylglucosaminyltransferase 2-like [Protopterus annectens]XP_043929717.1 N-acetyllactosaminide beta-1,3-N-acetylglucosaminyltransferase 2-like [Protopterus annectens]XP_043929718.1 N-acetyllactosaminide beta-1,3-N-acetylglucosaminyltransferase 2-like [Protopterus annectens]XP_043929719.1 N-acetyllactosaminide beta-1,3-N-acetylglucosaminyltransferase 2-like [Protopterus annectens]XP_043929720.1 N-acetyllactosaminide beta-1,3-N-acetylglucosaminyltransferase 2
MSTGRIKLYLWLICAFTANILVYTVIKLSKSSSAEILNGKKGVTIPQKFWKYENTEKMALWNFLQFHYEKSLNPVFNATKRKYDNSSFPETFQKLVFSTKAKQISSFPDQIKEFIWSMHHRNFTLVINQEHVCDEDLVLLLAVKSLIPNFDRRQAIRQTWGQAGKVGNVTVKVVFLLGSQDHTRGDPNLFDLLKFEERHFGDIIMWHFKDTFFNLTIKNLLFFQWLEDYCPNVHYIFQGDDDIFVNTVALAEYISTKDISTSQNMFVGQVISDASPVRDRNLKYYIPEEFYQGAYPLYAGGGGILYSASLARSLNAVSKHVVVFPIDDVYIGMCLHKLGIIPENHEGFRTFDIREEDRHDICIHKTLILVHQRSSQEVIKLWRGLHDPSLKC